MYNNLSAIGDCFDRYSLGVLLEPAMMAMQSLKKLLGFKSIDKPSWWHKESRKFMFYLPGVTIFLVVFWPCWVADSAVNLIRCSCGRCLSGVFGRLIVWLFLREGRKFHIVCCVYASGGSLSP